MCIAVDESNDDDDDDVDDDDDDAWIGATDDNAAAAAAATAAAAAATAAWLLTWDMANIFWDGRPATWKNPPARTPKNEHIWKDKMLFAFGSRFHEF